MLRGEIFLPGGEEKWFWQFEPFSKLKTAFCEYWTSDKIKISVTSVSKEYEVKAKMVQEQWLQLKMTFLLGYNLKKVYLVGGGESTFGGEGMKFGGGESTGGDFSRWGRMKNFRLVGPPSPPVRKILENARFTQGLLQLLFTFFG